MCNIAVATEPRSGLMVDPWEAFKSYQRTAVVLDHFDHEINDVLGGVEAADGNEKKRVHVMLLAGSDLISTMSEPGVWSEEDVSCLVLSICGLSLTRAFAVGSHPRKIRLPYN